MASWSSGLLLRRLSILGCVTFRGSSLLLTVTFAVAVLVSNGFLWACVFRVRACPRRGRAIVSDHVDQGVWRPAVKLEFDRRAFSELAAAVTGYHYHDEATVRELTAGDPWRCAAVVCTHAAVSEVALRSGSCIEVALQEFAVAAAHAAQGGTR